MPRKGENIYKRKDGRWEGRYIKSKSISGKAIYGYVYAKTYRETKEKLSCAVRDNNLGLAKKTDGCELFESIAQEWLETTKMSVKESSITGLKCYFEYLNHF